MDTNSLGEEFERHRPYLRAVAYQLLGSLADAEDAVQEAWLRLHRVDPHGIDHLKAWLTQVTVAHLSGRVEVGARAAPELRG